MQLRKKINKRYDKYVDKNRGRLINDFCREIKKEEIGNLTLDEYSKFRFWKHDQEDTLKGFYGNFKEDTKDSEIDFDEFCKFTWTYMDEVDGMYGSDLPDEIEAIIRGLKDDSVAEA